MTDFYAVEKLARAMCDAKHGEYTWERKGCKRNYWRRLASAEIERQHAINTADALMGIFGYRRAGK